MSTIMINGSPLEVFDMHIDSRPLTNPDINASRRFNEAMRSARQKIRIEIRIEFNAPAQDEFIPTGPIVKGSITPDCEQE